VTGQLQIEKLQSAYEHFDVVHCLKLYILHDNSDKFRKERFIKPIMEYPNILIKKYCFRFRQVREIVHWLMGLPMA
jgi:hypothetical protein